MMIRRPSQRKPAHRTFYRGIGFNYATKTGGPVLKAIPHKWKFINGIRIGHTWILFRRYDMLRKKNW